MTESDAVTRIDAAIRRIEEAIESRGGDHAALRERHAALRQEVADAIAGMDALATKGSD